LQRIRYGSRGITAREVLAAATRGGAALLGYDQAGILKEGALADIALFDVMKLEYAGALSDPIASLLFSGYDHGVDHLIVNGKFVVRSRKLSGESLGGVDEETIRANAEKAARRLYAAAGIR
jgi:cytosine/adenosine deaminase-related metal-dependent hydrolase